MTNFTIIVLVFMFASVTITSAVHQTEPTLPKSFQETTQRLPEQNADWQAIRTHNLLYIDKTPYLVKLLQRPGKLWYLTRPRRFGKSLFIDMMADYFKGKKDMFKGLAIEEDGNTKYLAEYIQKTEKQLPKWIKFPVILLNFGEITGFSTEEEFSKQYYDALKDIAVTYGLDPKAWSFFDLRALISGLEQKFNGLPIIILIDEYDHPFQYSFLELKNEKVAKAVRTVINSIFTIMKNSMRYLGLVFVTGVSKLSSVVLESTGITAFVDLTFEKDFAQAFGLTETEITSKMGPNLRYWEQNLEKKFGEPSEPIMESLKAWYDGYQFAFVNNSCKVLNPVSIISSVKREKCESYWASTGSLTYLIDKFYQEKYSWDLLEKGFSIARKSFFIKIDPLKSPPPLHIWMLMFGYYTISSYDESLDIVTLNFPNEEIKSVVEYYIAMYIPSQKKFIHEDFHSELSQLRNAMLIGDTNSAMEVLRSFVFRPYKHPLNIDQKPGEVTRRLALIFRAAGIKVEDPIQFNKDDNKLDSGGDIDILTVNLPINYLFENKCTNNKADTALSVIKQPIRYLRKHPKSFMKAIKNMSNYKIMAMNFQFEEGSIILNSWIAIPCINGTIQSSNMTTYPKDLKSRYLGNEEPADKQLICGPVLPKLT